MRAGSRTVAWGKEEELCSDERTAIDELIGRSVEIEVPEGSTEAESSEIKAEWAHNL